MKTGLNRKTVIEGDVYAKVLVNVFDLNTKKIVFTGGICDVANFIGATQQNTMVYLKRKSRYKKKYALRYAKNQQQ